MMQLVLRHKAKTDISPRSLSRIHFSAHACECCCACADKVWPPQLRPKKKKGTPARRRQLCVASFPVLFGLIDCDKCSEKLKEVLFQYSLHVVSVLRNSEMAISQQPIRHVFFCSMKYMSASILLDTSTCMYLVLCVANDSSRYVYSFQLQLIDASAMVQRQQRLVQSQLWLLRSKMPLLQSGV